jgi:hypothetical protein
MTAGLGCILTWAGVGSVLAGVSCSCWCLAQHGSLRCCWGSFEQNWEQAACLVDTDACAAVVCMLC